MSRLSRREFARLGIGGAALVSLPRWASGAEPAAVDVHEQILALAKRQEAERRARFAAVKTQAELETLQQSLREKFLRLIGGLPTSDGPPKSRQTGVIDADDYTIEKFVYESFPGYFVSAILYKPKPSVVQNGVVQNGVVQNGVVQNRAGRLPAVISPCGHSPEGKAAKTYQICHVNLVRRGYVVMSYDPVGQGERSQCWDAANHRSRYNLTCGEHAVLGNPLTLLGSSLARYRIWDGIRAIDYLTSRDDVDAGRIGCVGNSGGGTLTAYISALDARVKAAAIGCYITTLPRRMGNRIEADPDADPEQDIADFVSEGIDHAGLLALRAPQPTLLACAQFDFFPIEGARESYDEAKHLYETAGAGEKLAKVEAAERHGLSLPLRLGVYGFFERWLAGREAAGPVNGTPEELPVEPRPASELLACPDGQVSTSFQSRPLLPLAWEQFQQAPQAERKPLGELLRLDMKEAAPQVTPIGGDDKTADTVLLLVSGNESSDWREQSEALPALAGATRHVAIVEPRGVGSLRPPRQVKGKDYADPLVGVEENIAYNAMLAGRSLLGIRVADVIRAVERQLEIGRPRRIVLVGRRDAALVVALAAAVEPRITHVAVGGLPANFRSLFDAQPTPINAASILPNLLKHFGDIPEILAAIKPRPVLTLGDKPIESIDGWLK